jgi:hypothetical protein
MIMKADDAGVAGFFEDLPVLMFVLVGVATLVLCGTWVSRNLNAVQVQEELDSLAEDLVNSVMSRLLRPETPGLMPSVTSARNVDISDIASRVVGERHYLIAIIARYPSYTWLNTGSDNDTALPNTTGYCSRLLNVLDGYGSTIMLEVRAIVW